MREVARQTGEELLDEVAHSSIVSAVGAVKRYVNDRIGYRWLNSRRHIRITAHHYERHHEANGLNQSIIPA